MKKTTQALSLLSLASAASLIATPVVTLAVGKDVNYLVGIVNRSFTTAIYLIISFSILTFVYNVYNYYIKADADRKEAGIYVLMSVIGFFVILSFWGLVNIVKNSLNLDTGTPAGLFGGTTNNSNNPYSSSDSVSGYSPFGGGHTSSNDSHNDPNMYSTSDSVSGASSAGSSVSSPVSGASTSNWNGNGGY